MLLAIGQKNKLSCMSKILFSALRIFIVNKVSTERISKGRHEPFGKGELKSVWKRECYESISGLAAEAQEQEKAILLKALRATWQPSSDNCFLRFHKLRLLSVSCILSAPAALCKYTSLWILIYVWGYLVSKSRTVSLFDESCKLPALRWTFETTQSGT